MKPIVLFLLILILASCSNKKAELVEQIKSYNDSLVIVEKHRANLNAVITAVQEKYVAQQAVDSVMVLEEKQSAARADILIKQMNFKAKIDSLELELKKY
jgi:hypothetical protein